MKPDTLRIDCGWISPLFVTDDDARIAELQAPFVLILDMPVRDLWALVPMLGRIPEGRALLFVGTGIKGAFLDALVVNKQRGGWQFAAVNVPTRACLAAVRSFTGGEVIDENLGIDLGEVPLKMLGQAERVTVTETTTTIYGGHGAQVEPTAPASPPLLSESIETLAEPTQHRVGRPSAKDIIFAALDDLFERQHQVHKMAAVELAKLVAKSCGTALDRDRGWATRTVLGHIRDWRSSHPT